MSGELNPGLIADLEKGLQRQEAAQVSAALPLPGAAGDGFPSPNLKTKRFTVRPIVASDMAVMQRIESPFIQLAAEAQKPEAERQRVDFTAQDMVNVVYLFTTPAKEAYDTLKEGVEAFKDKAMESVGFSVKPEDIAEMFAAIGTAVPKSFETALVYGAESEEKGKVENFPVSSQA